MNRSRWQRTAVEMAALALATLLLWCALYGRTTAAAWRTPIFYEGDNLLTLAVGKAYAEAGPASVFDKRVDRLDAPYAADWNEWPITEDGLLYLHGIMDKLLGLGTAANLMLLLAHLLAVLSFYGAARWLRHQPSMAAGLALLYGFSPYLFWRGYGHLTLSFCWHLPLCLLAAGWAASRRRVGRAEVAAALAISAACGLQNIYYSFLFLQLLGWACLAQAARRRWDGLLLPAACAAAVLLAVMAGNLDTLLDSLRHGPNGGAVVRGYTGLEIYGLRPVELFLPGPDHRPPLLGWFWKSHPGEDGSVPLGLVGAVGAACLCARGAWAIAGRRPVPAAFGTFLWIVLFSAVGGVNSFLGIAGFPLFRATNRYSVALLAVALLFLSGWLSRVVPRRWGWAVALCLSLLGLWEQTPRSLPSRNNNATAETYRADRAFAAAMEAALPPGGMVFQLPVSDFPEHPPIVGMGDYEHLRPFLFTRNLRFSYGGDKGRAREEWQSAVAKLPPAALAARLRQYGFSAIYVDRRGYDDGGAALIAGLEAAGAVPVADRGPDGPACLGITPSPAPIPPFSPPLPGKGFYPEIERWRTEGTAWAKWNAELAVYNASPQPRRATLHLTLEAPSAGTVDIAGRRFSLIAREPQAATVTVPLPAGESTLRFVTHLPRGSEADAPGPFAFSIREVALSFEDDPGAH